MTDVHAARSASSPDALVDVDRAGANLADPKVRFLEVDVNTRSYDAGHLPGATGINWMTQLYADREITEDKEIVAYCRIGERSSHTWFVLSEMLGYPNVRNYDGSWTEYGSLVGVPIETGDGSHN